MGVFVLFFSFLNCINKSHTVQLLLFLLQADVSCSMGVKCVGASSKM